MNVNWHYIEISLAAVVIMTVFYMIIRHNRYTQEDDIMPEIGDVDALMEEGVRKPGAQQVKLEETEDIGEVRVLSPEETQRRLEAMNQKQEAYKSNIAAFQAQAAKVRQSSKKPDANQNTFILIHVMAQPGAKFIGYDLYQALTSAGLTYGEMKIFHRYAEKSERTNQILYSVASAVNPGQIDLDNIGAFSTIGLTLFMDFSKQKTASAAFQMMLNTAKLLAEDLNGILLDCHRQTWTLQSENESRRRIQQYNMHLGKVVTT